MKMLGMDPGAEFKVALEEAERLGARCAHSTAAC
jgi:pheromone shutdown protein TraB